MANLTINALAAVGTAGAVGVRVELTDARGNPVEGFSSLGAYIAPYTTATAADGTLTLALEPNANIVPENTYYTVTVGEKSYLITKGASTETLQAAIVNEPDPLAPGSSLRDLSDTSVAVDPDTGEVLTWDGTKWVNAAPAVTEAELTAAVAAETTAREDADALLVPLTQKGAANGVATLGADAMVPVAQLPAVALTDTFVVGNEATMLALNAERGDVAIRQDLSKSFILATDSPSTLADWKELLTPTDQVTSVNGRTGTVTGLAEASDLTAEVSRATTAEGTLTAAVASEASARATADTTLQNNLNAHDADTTSVHGIADTSTLVLTSDARLSDSRTPNGSAGGVLSGTYPNPGFAADMATQAELDAHAGASAGAHAATAISNTPAGNIAATTVQAALNELDSEKLDKSGGTMTGNFLIQPASPDAAGIFQVRADSAGAQITGFRLNNLAAGQWTGTQLYFGAGTANRTVGAIAAYFHTAADTDSSMSFSTRVSGGAAGRCALVGKDWVFNDITSVQFTASAGTKLGSATSEKLALWGATPIVQPANTVAIDTVLSTTGLRASGGIANFSADIAIGTNPAAVGAIRLPNGTAGAIYARNAGNTAQYPLIYLDTSDQVKITSGVKGSLQGAGADVISWSSSGITFEDGKNFAVGTTTGTKLGTAASQKLSLWNATPDVQPTTAITGAAYTANAGIDTATWGGYTIGQIVAALKRIGALA